MLSTGRIAHLSYGVRLLRCGISIHCGRIPSNTSAAMIRTSSTETCRALIKEAKGLK
jgi:hypothetical protein